MRGRHLLAGLCAAGLLAGCSAGRTGSGERSSFVRDAQGRKLHVLSVGSGADTVVVLAGGPGVPAAYLAPLLRDLAGGRTLLAIEPLGVGGSDGRTLVPDSSTVERQVDDVALVVDSLHIGRMAILAHHAGALLAERLVHRMPGRVTRVALVAPIYPRARYQFTVRRDTARLAPAPADLVRLYDSGLVARDPARFCREAWPVFFGPATYWEPTVRSAIAGPLCTAPPAALARVLDVKRAMLTSLGDWEWRDSLRTMPVPLLVVQGTGLDRAYVHGARNWARYAPEGRIVEVPAHPLMPWVDRRVTVTRALSDFLSGTMPAEARQPALADVVGPDDSVPPPGADTLDLRRAKALARSRATGRST